MNAAANDKNYARGAGRQNSYEDCQKLCQETRGCMFFTYDSSDNDCYLKDNYTGRKSHSGAVSGPKYCVDCKCLGYCFLIYCKSYISRN